MVESERDNPPRRGQTDLRAQMEEVANREITERFNGIGIDDSSFEARQITNANFRLLNTLRESKEARDLRFKRSIWSIVTSISGNLLWALGVAIFAWLIQALVHGNIPNVLK
jgi:hypothetical protein